MGKIPNPKRQIPNRYQLPKFQIIGLGHGDLDFGIYLGFGICSLEFI
jgi:hypothetical protein